METDLDSIKQLSEERHDENWQFRAFLKGSDTPSRKIDRMVHRLYEEVSSQIDCTTCANCCKEIRAVLDQEDIENLSKCLGLSAVEFRKQYLVQREKSDEFVFKEKPCPLLRDNRCSYYDCRPKACRAYPYLHKDDFVFRLIGVIKNSSICPIVFNVYEYLKAEIWHSQDFEYFDDVD
ncbi:MAG: YkgJ family cysteine cluster protein [Thermodesulfobacteriota bacterium]|nr:YkgJ family cysteine cluster protein [Thermodesulfobacteriota bacterium]